MKKFSSTMRANSRQTSRNLRTRTILVVGLGAVLLVMILPRAIGMVSSVMFEPIARSEAKLFDFGSLLPSYFTDRDELVDRIRSLERQIELETIHEHTVDMLVEENMTLRSLLGDEDEERIVASVIGRPTVTPYDTLVLDVGSDAGVMVHAPVYVGNDQVIGFVAEVFPKSAIVVLATTPKLESTVYILGPNIYTTAEGQGGGVLRVSVPQGIVLSVGDLVLVPSFGGGIFGTIDVIESVPTEPEQHGFVTLQVPLQSLRVVSVGKRQLTPQSFEEAKRVVEAVRTDLTRVPVPSGVLVDVDILGSTTASSTASSTVESASRSSDVVE